MTINHNRILLTLVFSMLYMIEVFAQQVNWQHQLGFSPAISIMPVESNAGFAYVGRLEQEMPYGIIPKDFTVFKSYLQYQLLIEYQAKFKNRIVLISNFKTSFSTMTEVDILGFTGFSSDFQFYAFNLGVGYDFLPKKLDEDLVLSVVGSGIYNRDVTRHVSYPNGEPSTPFQEVGEENFVRKGFSLGWGIELKWVDYFSAHWGYSVIAEYSATRVEPSKMTLTEFYVNGVDELSTLTTRQKEYEFGNVANDEPNSPNKAKVLPKEYYEYAFFTLGVAVNYRF